MACPFFEANAVYWVSATSASDTQQRSWSSHTARGQRIGVHASSLIDATAALTAGSVREVTEKYAPARPAAWHAAAL